MMVIALASDHAGYDLRKSIANYLREKNYGILEFGAVDAKTPVSYVGAGQSASAAVLSGEAKKAVVICGTGIGISMVCNKYKGIRCALCTNEYMARMSREHNDANVLALGGRIVGSSLAISIVAAFLESHFEEGGRHQIRVSEIGEQESGVFYPGSK